MSVRLLIASHKLLSTDPSTPSGHATAGGFSAQTGALATLAESCVLCVPVGGPAEPGLTPIDPAIEVHPLRHPGTGWRRRLAVPGWILQLRREVLAADVVHAPVPGDVGFLAVIVTVLCRRPLFVRHCATWRRPASRADKVLKAVLERLSDRGVVVLATGADDRPPTEGRSVRWIFSSSVTQADIDEVAAQPVGLAGAEDPEAAPVLVTGGRLIPSKGTDHALEAFAVLRDRGLVSHLHVVGEGPARGDLEARAASLGVADAVTFHGLLSRRDVLDVFDRSDLLVYPTRSNEGFPKIVLEALSRRLPVVATPVSAIPSLVGDAGMIVAPDVASVVDGVVELLDEPGGLAARRDRALARAAHHTLEAWVAEIGRHLDEAWGTRRDEDAEGASAPRTARHTEAVR